MLTGEHSAADLLRERAAGRAGGTATAVFNPARTHRFLLTRTWDDDRPPMAWVMLNPSTADAAADDPTITRCVAHARRGRFGGIAVVNHVRPARHQARSVEGAR